MNRIIITRLNLDEIASDPEVLDKMRPIAASISKTANQTSAKIGITYEMLPDRIRIGATGAPAVALEFGTVSQPARRHVKRALDRHEIG